MRTTELRELTKSWGAGEWLDWRTLRERIRSKQPDLTEQQLDRQAFERMKAEPAVGAN